MIEKLRQILGEKLKEDVPLRDFTTFRIGGLARYFFIGESEEEIVKAIKAAKDLGLDYFILGGGSNLLVSDEGYGGLVIQIKDLRLKIKDNRIESGAGVPLQVLVQEAAKAGLSGLEQAAGIPGTLGGAIYGNAGSGFTTPKPGGGGWAIGDAVKSVKLFWPDGKIKEKDRGWMEFGYRESKLKKFSAKERPIILSAVLELAPGNPDEIKKIMAEKTASREQKFPKEPSAGCVFKNPEGIFVPSNNRVQSVGQLIDSLGLKGKCIGGACVSELHGNFIINKGNAIAKDVKELIDLIKKKVKEEKGIELEEEIQSLGFY